MAQQTLAVKYRPRVWSDVVEQDSIRTILQQQLKDQSIKNAYLFCGGAGTGKTTCARIFADEINQGHGNPIEMDAASHNGVDDVRDIIQQAKTKSINSDYKVFIIDECHSISNTGWQAFLKMIEEPPAKSVFIFCTTDPRKIPKTILSRVQRYDFHRISQQGIVDRLHYILDEEGYGDIDKVIDIEPLEYIAKIADGGMRDAISLMDKCLSYSSDLTIENVVKALGVVDYDVMVKLTQLILDQKSSDVMKMIEAIHSEGKDLKQFIKSYLQFMLDVQKYGIGCQWSYLNIPRLDTYDKWLSGLSDDQLNVCLDLLSTLMGLNADIKYSTSAKYDIEACLLCFVMEG